MLQAIEFIITMIVRQSKASNFTILRVFRIVRLIRVLRSVRILRLFREIRTMVVAVMVAVRPLLGAIFVLGLVLYIAAVYFTESALKIRLETDLPESTAIQLDALYGSLDTTMLSLFQSIFGGLDWAEMSSLLNTSGSRFAGRVVFPFLVAFCMLALMNIVTGIVISTVGQIVEKDRTECLKTCADRILKTIWADEPIEFSDLESVFSKEGMKSEKNIALLDLFNVMEFEEEDAMDVFFINDQNEQGSVEAGAYVERCLKTKAQVTKLDNQLLMRVILDLRCELLDQLTTLRGRLN